MKADHEQIRNGTTMFGHFDLKYIGNKYYYKVKYSYNFPVYEPNTVQKAKFEVSTFNGLVQFLKTDTVMITKGYFIQQFSFSIIRTATFLSEL